MSETNETPAGEDALELVEVETEVVDDEGNVVVDDLVAAVDGDVVVDETIAVRGDDGRLHAVEEDVTVVEADDEE